LSAEIGGSVDEKAAVLKRRVEVIVWQSGQSDSCCPT